MCRYYYELPLNEKFLECITYTLSTGKTHMCLPAYWKNLNSSVNLETFLFLLWKFFLSIFFYYRGGHKRTVIIHDIGLRIAGEEEKKKLEQWLPVSN